MKLRFQEVIIRDIECKFCREKQDLARYGKKKDIQYFFCYSCNRKFADNKAPEQMKYSSEIIASAINLFYEGLSFKKIERQLIQSYGKSPSTSNLYNWVTRFTLIAINKFKDCQADTGNTWVADETVLKIDKKNIWFWDVIDEDTKFLLASHISINRTTENARLFMQKALDNSIYYPSTIITDKLQAYIKGIKDTFKKKTEHVQSKPFTIKLSTNVIERFHGTLKDRTKIMRGLKSIHTARLFTEGWLIHYNFFRPHMSIKNKTPAEKANIDVDSKNWLEIVNSYKRKEG